MLAHFCEAQADLSTIPVVDGMFHNFPTSQQDNATTMGDLIAQCLLDSMSSAPAMIPDDPTVSVLTLMDTTVHIPELANSTQQQT